MISLNVKFVCLINWKLCLKIVGMVFYLINLILFKFVLALIAQMISKKRNALFADKKAPLKKFLFENNKIINI